jgi:hypothetical protein
VQPPDKVPVLLESPVQQEVLVVQESLVCSSRPK